MLKSPSCMVRDVRTAERLACNDLGLDPMKVVISATHTGFWGEAKMPLRQRASCCPCAVLPVTSVPWIWFAGWSLKAT